MHCHFFILSPNTANKFHTLLLLMSITSLFLLFLLCFSLYACSARRLGKVHHTNTLQEKLHHLPIKSDMNHSSEKNSVAVVLEAKSHADEMDDRDDNQKLEDGVVNHKSVVSVSWRVPHRKRGGKHPGFNLDYSPPKTHPPSHN